MAAALTIALRPMLPDDGATLAAIFAASIDELTGEDYSAGQQAAWIATAESESAFSARLQGMVTILAMVEGETVGFASLRMPDTLEMLYVRPDSVGQGIASALCDAMVKIAQARGAKALSVAASDTAQPFFAKRGFEAVRRETIPLEDEWIGRTVMSKPLAPKADTQH